MLRKEKARNFQRSKAQIVLPTCGLVRLTGGEKNIKKGSAKHDLSMLSRRLHCGVLEFIANEGSVLMPHWVSIMCLFFMSVYFHCSCGGIAATTAATDVFVCLCVCLFVQ